MNHSDQREEERGQRSEKGDMEILKDITFRELRDYLSVIDRLSICMLKGNCQNFIYLRDVPDTYDAYYVYGIGMIESEFYKDGEYFYTASGKPEDRVFVNCIEVKLTEEPKSVLVKRMRESGEIRNKGEGNLEGDENHDHD